MDKFDFPPVITQRWVIRLEQSADGMGGRFSITPLDRKSNWYTLLVGLRRAGLEAYQSPGGEVICWGQPLARIREIIVGMG